MIMAKSQVNTNNPHVEYSSQDVHKNVVIFNHISSNKQDNSALKNVIEKQIASLDVPWKLVPVS